MDNLQKYFLILNDKVILNINFRKKIEIISNIRNYIYYYCINDKFKNNIYDTLDIIILHQFSRIIWDITINIKHTNTLTQFGKINGATLSMSSFQATTCTRLPLPLFK